MLTNVPGWVFLPQTASLTRTHLTGCRPIGADPSKPWSPMVGTVHVLGVSTRRVERLAGQLGREDGRLVHVHALIATGINADGHRAILGLEMISAEDGAGWRLARRYPGRPGSSAAATSCELC